MYIGGFIGYGSRTKTTGCISIQGSICVRDIECSYTLSINHRWFQYLWVIVCTFWGRRPGKVSTAAGIYDKFSVSLYPRHIIVSSRTRRISKEHQARPTAV